MLEPGDPKDPDDSTVFQVWQAFATPEQTAEMRQAFSDGIAWGEAKKQLFELINKELAESREKYNQWMSEPEKLEEVLQYGAEKARKLANERVEKVKQKVGLRSFSA